MRHVLLIGAQKAGTTFLHSLLAQDSAVATASEKEPHFFTKPSFAGLRYSEQFNTDSHSAITLDSSASYLHVGGTAERIVNAIGSAPLIVVLLRDPVERAVSGFLHQAKHGRDARSPASVFSFDAQTLNEAREEEDEKIRKALLQGLIQTRREDPYLDPLWIFRYVTNSSYKHQLAPFQARFNTIMLFDFRMLTREPAGVVGEVRSGARLASWQSLKLETARNKTKFKRLKAIRRNLKDCPEIPFRKALCSYAVHSYASDHLRKLAGGGWAVEARDDYQALLGVSTSDLQQNDVLPAHPTVADSRRRAGGELSRR